MSLDAPRWRPFTALPSYFGGKRRLVTTIFREVDRVFPRRLWRGMTLVDAFLWSVGCKSGASYNADEKEVLVVAPGEV